MDDGEPSAPETSDYNDTEAISGPDQPPQPPDAGPGRRRLAVRSWQVVLAASAVIGLLAGTQQLLLTDSANTPTPSNTQVVERSISAPSGTLSDPVVDSSGVEVGTLVALPGSVDTWASHMQVAPGAAVSVLAEVANGSEHQIDDVVVRVELDDDVTPLDVELVNGNYPTGYEYPSGSDAIASTGVNIGSYGPGILGYVRVRVALPDHECGRRLFALVINVRYGDQTVQNSASVEAVAPC